MNQAGAPDGPGEIDSQPIRPPEQQILDTFARARPMSVGNAGREPGGTVKLAGRAVPGPGGPLRAPLSGAECVWYRSLVFRHLASTTFSSSRPLEPMQPFAPSDLDYVAQLTYGLSGRRFGSDRSSTAPFGLDDGTGAITVDPSAADMDSNIFAINALVTVDDPSRDRNALGFGGGPFDHQELHAEWIIPVGAPLLAVGTVQSSGAQPALVASAQDVVLVSTKPEQQVLGRNRAAVDPEAVHLPFRTGRSAVVFVAAVMTVGLAVVITLIALFVVPH